MTAAGGARGRRAGAAALGAAALLTLGAVPATAASQRRSTGTTPSPIRVIDFRLPS